MENKKVLWSLSMIAASIAILWWLWTYKIWRR